MDKVMVDTITVPMPAFLYKNLGVAAKMFEISKADIMRSVLYDFLVSADVIKQGQFDSPDDVVIKSV